MDLMDDQCLWRLRFRKDIVMELCNLLQPDLQRQTRLGTALTVASKVTIALNFYATGSFQAATADISSISQFATHSSMGQVTDALCKRRRDHISFLMSREKQLEQQTRFVRFADFPRVQNAIDCTHVALRALQNNPEFFRNRKVFYSLYVQLVCNHNHKIIAVDAQYPGSSHDAFILCQTGMPGVFAGPNQDCSWFLGDKGYPLCTGLLTPLRNPRTAAQQAYNDSQSAIRCIIEQTIGILKQSFRCLDRSGGVLQYSPEQVSLFVVVCFMLHNLAIKRAQPLEDEAAVPPDEEDQEEEAQEHDMQQEEEEAQEEDQDEGRRPRRKRRSHRDPAREGLNHLIAVRFR
uniref:putative nuclease HARBI1 n=1 Tax=Pristiophorus japonicus TaxID=55135 RepID=UPI00398F01F7